MKKDFTGVMPRKKKDQSLTLEKCITGTFSIKAELFSKAEARAFQLYGKRSLSKYIRALIEADTKPAV